MQIETRKRQRPLVQTEFLGSESADPDAGCGGLAEVNGAARGAQRHGFVILAFLHFDLGAGTQAQFFEEFQKLRVFFVDGDDFRFIAGLKLGKEQCAFFAQLGDAAAERNSVRTALVRGKPFDEQRFHFGRNGVLKAFGFIVSARPGQTNDVGEQHFRQLMTQGHTLRDLAAFCGQIDAAGAVHANEVVAGHAFQRGGDGRRSDVEGFGDTGAYGRAVFLEKFPNGLQVIFLGYAGFIALQRVSSVRGGRAI